MYTGHVNNICYIYPTTSTLFFIFPRPRQQYVYNVYYCYPSTSTILILFIPTTSAIFIICCGGRPKPSEQDLSCSHTTSTIFIMCSGGWPKPPQHYLLYSRAVGPDSEVKCIGANIDIMCNCYKYVIELLYFLAVGSSHLNTIYYIFMRPSQILKLSIGIEIDINCTLH